MSDAFFQSDDLVSWLLDSILPTRVDLERENNVCSNIEEAFALRLVNRHMCALIDSKYKKLLECNTRFKNAVDIYSALKKYCAVCGTVCKHLDNESALVWEPNFVTLMQNTSKEHMVTICFIRNPPTIRLQRLTAFSSAERQCVKFLSAVKGFQQYRDVIRKVFSQPDLAYNENRIYVRMPLYNVQLKSLVHWSRYSSLAHLFETSNIEMSRVINF
tara:strand:- start:73 stop:720 length:648 start_codon:yes stop_codon:yes gene_type:complete